MPGLLSLAVRSSWVLVALLFNTYSQAAEVEIVTGEHWVKSTPEQKRAYLIGVANVLQIERAYHGRRNNPPSDDQSLIPRMAKGLSGTTLDGVSQGLDAWYAKNPEQLKRPVIEVIWFEMVVPGLRPSK
jgi:hypothetical protein